MQNNICQTVSNAGSSEQSKLSVDTSTTWSINDLENLIQRSTTDLLTCQQTPRRKFLRSRKEQLNFLIDDSNAPFTVQPAQLPVGIERPRCFGNEIQSLPE